MGPDFSEIQNHLNLERVIGALPHNKDLLFAAHKRETAQKAVDKLLEEFLGSIEPVTKADLSAALSALREELLWHDRMAYQLLLSELQSLRDQVQPQPPGMDK